MAIGNAERNITRDYDKGVEIETTPMMLGAAKATVEVNGVAYPCTIVAVESVETRKLIVPKGRIE